MLLKWQSVNTNDRVLFKSLTKLSANKGEHYMPKSLHNLALPANSARSQDYPSLSEQNSELTSYP